MQALILDDCPRRQTDLSVALMSRGFHVLNAQTNATGLAFARRGALDLVVMSERVQGALTHSVALSAERHSPYVATILLTQRKDDDLQELYDLLPSLYSILGQDMSCALIGELALAGVTGATRHTDMDRLLLLPNGRHIDPYDAPMDPSPAYNEVADNIFVEDELFSEWVFSSTHQPLARDLQLAAE